MKIVTNICRDIDGKSITETTCINVVDVKTSTRSWENSDLRATIIDLPGVTLDRDNGLALVQADNSHIHIVIGSMDVYEMIHNDIYTFNNLGMILILSMIDYVDDDGDRDIVLTSIRLENYQETISIDSTDNVLASVEGKTVGKFTTLLSISDEK